MRTADVINEISKEVKQKRFGGISAIVEETGLPISWLYKVSQGAIKSPSSERIDTLRDYFSSKSKAAWDRPLFGGANAQ